MELCTVMIIIINIKLKMEIYDFHGKLEFEGEYIKGEK